MFMVSVTAMMSMVAVVAMMSVVPWTVPSIAVALLIGDIAWSELDDGGHSIERDMDSNGVLSAVVLSDNVQEMIAAGPLLYCLRGNMIGLVVRSKGLVDNSHALVDKLLGLGRNVVIH
jgi:hypothetical protein